MAPKPRKRISINLLIPFLIIVLVFTALIWRKYQTSHVAPTVRNGEPDVSGTRSAVLFFANGSGQLVREVRHLEPCEGAEACLRDVLEELLNGPVGEFEQPLPDGTIINSLKIQDTMAVIDLNGLFADTMPSGSSAEMLAVYSIVDTVITNAPLIQKVKITVEGNAMAHLNHLDLSEPLAPDYSMELQRGGTGQTPPLSPKGTP